MRKTLSYLAAQASAVGLKELEAKLLSSPTLAPCKVNIKDISGGCGSFFHVEVTSNVFAGQPLVKQHRLVNEALRDEIKQIHGLTIVTKAS